MTIERVREEDLPELLVLMRAYLDFYEASPSDADVLALCRALLAGPEHEGVQLIARSEDGAAVGFATVFWGWSTLRAARAAVMNDLYVVPEARGRGVAEALIAACGELAAARGAPSLQWQTALDNHRAQAVYDRVGAAQERWLSYRLDVRGG